MSMRSLDVSHNRDAAKKLRIVANLMMTYLLFLAYNYVGQKLQILLLCPLIRKRDTVDSFSDETDKEIDKAREDCNYKPTKKCWRKELSKGLFVLSN